MNHKMVLYMTGQILRIGGALFLLPLAVALIYREQTALVFLIVAAASFLVGQVLKMIARPKDSTVYARDGFVIVSIAWIVLSLVGALPFYISGEIPSYIDALFETVSGFTTTGASVITNFERISKSLIFWRSFTQWIGGMGIIVLAMAILPTTSGSSMHIMRAEVPGPMVGKLVPKLRNTARVLYLIYVVLTAVQIVFLACGDMTLFESIVHSFATASTGGFGIKLDSLASYSEYSQWVIAAFMFVFGINFNMYYLILLGKIRSVLKSEELRLYIAIIAASALAIGINIYSMYGGLYETVKHALFQTVSVMTTTAFTTADFNLWPTLSRTILVLIMIIGGCACSTAGGFKLSRVYIIIRMVQNGIKKMIRPRSVTSVSFEGKIVDDVAQKNLYNYFGLYSLMFAGFFVVITVCSPESHGLSVNLSAVLSCFNNIGPGPGGVGITISYCEYSAMSKLLLSAAMLFGRLEIYPLLLALTPSTWTKKT